MSYYFMNDKMLTNNGMNTEKMLEILFIIENEINDNIHNNY